MFEKCYKKKYQASNVVDCVSNITYILGIDIAIWLVFHLALDVVMMKRGMKEV